MTEEGIKVKENKELLPAIKGTEIPSEIPAEIGELVEEMGEEKVKQVIEVVHAELELHRGPLPHPKTFGKYEEVLPGAADRILIMAEKQQDHRMGIEKNVIDGDIQRANLGLKLGFTLFLSFGVGGFVLLLIGKDIQGYVLLATSFLGGVGNFIRVGREREKQIKKDDKKPKINLKRDKKKLEDDEKETSD